MVYIYMDSSFGFRIGDWYYYLGKRLWGFTSRFAWACCARWVPTLISVNEPLMVINAACLRTLSPLSVLAHVLREWSLMLRAKARCGYGR